MPNMRVTGFNLKKAAADSEVFVVKKGGGTGDYDGIYAEEGEENNLRYKRMGGAMPSTNYGNYGDYLYLYWVTERADTWVLGLGRTFEGSLARYRAPAGGGGDQLPAEEGWQDVSGWQWVNDGSRDG